MLENIIMALVTGLVVPMLLEGWRNRQGKAHAPAPAVGSNPTPASVPAASPAPGRTNWHLLRSFARLFLAATIGFVAALVISIQLDPDTNDFTSTDAVLSVLCIGIIWFVLGKVGPLKYSA
jgi:hypothetical protein